MTKTLLTDRFKLKVHYESKEVPGFALVVAKGGSKLNAGAGGENGDRVGRRGGCSPVTFENVPILRLVDHLIGRVDAPIVDKTALAGRYSFSLMWTPDDSEKRGGASQAPGSGCDPSGSLLNAFVWNTTSLLATRLLTGVGLSAMTVVAITYVSEMFPARCRGAYQGKIMTIGICGLPVTADVARFLIPAAAWGWRGVFVWDSLGLLFTLFAYKLEESPRWYESRGRLPDAESVLERIEARVRKDAGPLPPVPPHTAAWTPRRGGFDKLVSAGYLDRTVLFVSIWICQTLGFYGFVSWVPTLLAAHGFSILNSLQLSSALSLGAVPGAWIASIISVRWERKTLLAIVVLAVAACGLIYGLSSTTVTIVTFGFLVLRTAVRLQEILENSC